MSERSAEHATFVIERTYPASSARVFNAFADAEAKARWFVGPDEFNQGPHELDFRVGAAFDFEVAASFTARLVAELEAAPLPAGTLLNINVPCPPAAGVEVARLGKRVYKDELALVDEGDGGRRQYRIYGDASYERDETGTDLAAVAQGKIAVTPVHFDLTDREGLSVLQRYDLERLVQPAASEVTDR